MSISLLVDKYACEEFLDTVFPNLRDDEVLIAIICARKKYSEALSTSQEMLDKMIIKTEDIGSIVDKLFKFGVVAGIYKDYKLNTYISPSAMAMYIDLYPKSSIKAFFEFTKTINNWMYEAMNNQHFNKHVFRRLDSKLFSAIAKCNSRKPYTIVDVDRKDVNLPNILEHVSDEPLWISETRGGYHIIFKRSNIVNRDIVFLKSNFDYIEVQFSQGLTPVVGSLQGMFEVRKWNW